jgi:hypothetical protein
VSGGADLSYEFEIGERSGKLSAGADVSRSARDYDFLQLFSRRQLAAGRRADRTA